MNGRTIINNVSTLIKEGKITVLLGVNGSGKSTLLKAISNVISVHSGTVYLDGKSITRISTKKVAKKWQCSLKRMM
ncbi:ATP-binding cassette domain-containing protein [Rossellomorea sp. BNER]|uniref:ATP-binding cassette domain-containing protein n=1 Tax=Rossellomorea sp. BNER TaxID=2962031 RepID=UPI003AF2732D